ncbi:hypothetical protein AB4Z21_33795 [Paenibacillus sp. MCAF20]
MKLTDIRYVITPDQLAYVTLLATGRKFVVSAAFFRNTLGLHPRTVLGATSVTQKQLDRLVIIPVSSREEVAADVRTPVLA